MRVEKVGKKYRIQKSIKGRRFNLTFDHRPTKKEIEEAIALAYTDDASLDAPSGSFKEYALKYIAAKQNVLSPSTLHSYRGLIRGISDEFNNMQLKDITEEAIQIEINRLAVDKSPKTVANYHGFISPVLKMYKPKLHFDTTLPAPKPYKPTLPTDADIKALLEEVRDSRYELAFRLGVYALRRSEVCAVTVDDLNGNILTIHQSLVVGEKGGLVLKDTNKTELSTRDIYVDDRIVQLLQEQKKGFSGYPGDILRELHRVQDRLGIPRCRLHDLRHYYVSMAHSLGIPDKYIMAAGGWKTEHVLKRVYMHAQEEKEQDMMKFASDYITEQLK